MQVLLNNLFLCAKRDNLMTVEVWTCTYLFALAFAWCFADLLTLDGVKAAAFGSINLLKRFNPAYVFL